MSSKKTKKNNVQYFTRENRLQMQRNSHNQAERVKQRRQTAPENRRAHTTSWGDHVSNPTGKLKATTM